MEKLEILNRIRDLKRERTLHKKEMLLIDQKLEVLEVQPALDQLVESDIVDDELSGARYLNSPLYRRHTNGHSPRVVSLGLEPGELTADELAWIESSD